MANANTTWNRCNCEGKKQRRNTFFFCILYHHGTVFFCWQPGNILIRCVKCIPFDITFPPSQYTNRPSILSCARLVHQENKTELVCPELSQECMLKTDIWLWYLISEECHYFSFTRTASLIKCGKSIKEKTYWLLCNLHIFFLILVIFCWFDSTDRVAEWLRRWPQCQKWYANGRKNLSAWVRIPSLSHINIFNSPTLFTNGMLREVCMCCTTRIE